MLLPYRCGEFSGSLPENSPLTVVENSPDNKEAA